MKIKSGIKLLEKTEGSGRVIENGDSILVNLNAWLNAGEKIQTDIKINIDVGSRRAIAGVEYSVFGMKKQGKRKVKVSPHLAYGEKDVDGLIPKNVVLIYEIEVLDIV